MDELLKWLPALLAAGSAVIVVATLRASSKFSEWRHDKNEARIKEHDEQLAEHESKLAVLEDRTGPHRLIVDKAK